jgi:hypothetical protein
MSERVANPAAPATVARIRLFLGLVAAEQIAFAIAVLPGWSPGRAAIAATGLSLGVMAALLCAWRLGRGEAWPLIPAWIAGIAAMLQAFLIHSPSPAAYLLLGCAGLWTCVEVGRLPLLSIYDPVGRTPPVSAVSPKLGPGAASWLRGRAWLAVAAMLIAGFASPTIAATTFDPTLAGPHDLSLSVLCETSSNPSAEVVTVHVKFHWQRSDALPFGQTGAPGPNDAVGVWAQENGMLQEYLTSYPSWDVATGFPIHHVELQPDAWAASTGPFHLEADGGIPRVPFGRADSWTSVRGLPQSQAKQLVVDWHAIQAGTTYAATWVFQADPGTKPAFVEVEYEHLSRTTFQVVADCAHPTTTYPTHFYVMPSS